MMHARMGVRTVAVVAYDAVNLFQIGISTEIFGVERPELGVPWYNFMLCAAKSGPIRSSTGVMLATPYDLRHIAEADTVIVPSSSRFRSSPAPDSLLEAMRVAYRRGTRIVSFCTGAFLLAAAGLLDGRRATTHWAWAAELAERYPAVLVDQQALYVDDGQVLTAAGNAAGIDLSLHIVRQDYGAEIAAAVARRMVAPLHRDGGQAQYIETPLLVSREDDLFDATLAWVATHLDHEMNVEALAAMAVMSPRTFARRFSATMGTTPHQWILRQRLALAQRLLETTDASIERIAAQSGFRSTVTLRAHFQRFLCTSPQTYRRAFQGERIEGASMALGTGASALKR
jgi:AraC family transcriptional activator FtrA